MKPTEIRTAQLRVRVRLSSMNALATMAEHSGDSLSAVVDRMIQQQAATARDALKNDHNEEE